MPSNPVLTPSDSTGGASQALVSANGRYIVYTSTASNVVPGQVDTAVASNVFLYDRQTGTTTLVSHTPGSATTGADGDSDAPRVSSDGRFVVYESKAADLVAGQAGLRGEMNVFLYDATTGINTLVSHRFNSATTAADDLSETSLATGFGFGANSGRFLLFSSFATDLVAGQNGPITVNLFLYDTSTGTTTLVSHTVSSRLTGCDDETFQADITPDGKSVVFESLATDEVPGEQTGGEGNIFLYNPATDTTRLISGSFEGSANSPTDAADDFSYLPLISADGRIITYISQADDLVNGQVASSGGATQNVFCYDTVLGTTSLVSHAAGSFVTTGNDNCTEEVVSADGSTIAFLSKATNLTAGQGANSGNVFLYDTASGALTLASHVAGAPAVAAGAVDVINSGTFDDLSLSADGRFLCYEDLAGDVAAGQSGPSGGENVFLYDRLSGQNTLVSRVDGTAATAGDNDSLFGYLSPDGSSIALLSGATNLVPGLTVADSGQNLFVYDVPAGTGPALVSRSAFQAAGSSLVYGSSADGRYVVFTSDARNVVPGQVDTNFDQDVFLLDRTTGAITLVSHVPGSPTTTGDSGAYSPAISADGNWVVFDSFATNLAAGESGEADNEFLQVFLFSRMTGVVTLVSHDSGSPTAVADDASDSAVVSADGRFVAYRSYSSDLIPGFVPGSGTDTPNIYLYDTATGANTLVSHAAGLPLQGGGVLGSFTPVISDDGRFVAYASESTDLVLSGSISPTNNVYLFDSSAGTNTLVSHVPSSATTSPTASSLNPVISADGSTVAFVSFATDLVPGQQAQPSGSSYTNVFVYSVASGAVSLASGHDGSATQTAGGYSDSPSLNSDGSEVAFRSDAPDLVAGQVNSGTGATGPAFDPVPGTAGRTPGAAAISKPATTTTVTASPRTATPASTVTLTVDVSVSPPASGTPTGVVTFYDTFTPPGGSSSTQTSVGTVALVNGQASLSVSSLANGTHVYTAVYSGDANFAASTSAATANSTVTVSQDASTLNDDFADTDPSTSVTLDVLANDSSPYGFNPSTVEVQTLPTHGAVFTDPSTGEITYTPGSGFLGTDTFTYTVQDNAGTTLGPAHVTVTVGLPTANDDFATTNAGSPVTIDVLANDTDPAGHNELDPSSVTVIRPPAHGTASLDPATGRITYTPSTGFSGTDTFSYMVGDVNGAVSNPARVTVVVNPSHTFGVPSAVTLTAAPASTTAGSTVTLTAKITPSVAGQFLPLTGAVTFLDTYTPPDDTTPTRTTVGTIALDISDQASLVTSPLAAGTHVFTVVYSGDVNYAGGESVSTTVTVSRPTATAPTTTTLTAVPTTATAASPVTLTATITGSLPGGVTPTGVVTFLDSYTPPGSATPTRTTVATVVVLFGSASAIVSSLPAGTHVFTAVYSGDANFAASESPTESVTVSQAGPSGSTSNVFLVDRQTGGMTLISHDAGSPLTTASGDSSAPSLDGAGDLVVYLSTATDLVPGQQGGGVNNVFLYSVPLGAANLPANALLSGQGGSPVVASSNPAFQAIISRDPVALFSILSAAGGASVAYVNRLVELVLAPNSGADGSAPGTVVGTVSVSSVLAGQFLPPQYQLPSGEANDASFALRAAAPGTVYLLIEVPASYAAQQSYQVSVDFNLGLGDDSGLLQVVVAAPGPPPPGGIRAEFATVKVRKRARLMVQVFSVATGTMLGQFLSPFQRPAYKNIQLAVLGGNGGGVQEIVLTARQHRRTVTRSYIA
jgi:hypothetical protein